jgi:enediyne biosynthesis protein E5
MSLRQDRASHLPGLRRFAVAITILNVLGHAFFGFEQSFAQPLVSLAAAYSTELVLEAVDACCNYRRPRFAGGLPPLIDFLLSGHISGLAVAMLLYANDRLWVLAFAAATAIGSKAVFRVAVGSGTRHFFNPSNFGITVTLLLFPWVGQAPPYQFTENLSGLGDWILPGVIVLTGSFLNARFTGRLPLIMGWLGGFALQAALRSLLFQTPLVAGLIPMTGVAFVLFTFYMVTDPATTPERPWAQFNFGAAVAASYGLLMAAHVVFGLFFALSTVCALRGLGLCVLAARRALQRARGPIGPVAVGVPILVGETAK